MKIILLLLPAISSLVISCSNDKKITSVDDAETILTDLDKNNPDKAEELRGAFFIIYMPYVGKDVNMKTTVPDEIKGLTVDEVIKLSKTDEYADARKRADAFNSLMKAGMNARK